MTNIRVAVLGTQPMVDIVEAIDEIQDWEGWTNAALIASHLGWDRPRCGAVLGHCVKAGWVEVRSGPGGDRYGLTDKGGEIALGAAP